MLPSEEAIFHAARAITAANERAAYLVEACGADAALRARVEALLKVYLSERGDDGLVPAGSAIFDQLANAPPLEEPVGTIIGRYKLLERIGEGGFGVVFMAEQQHPVRRKVALKVIKPGLDTRQVITRFEAERQALAMMEHENIARVLDAGATDTGRPYFVMELVNGVPITEYCDQQQLSPRQRLELFVQVCRAVQHAHTKGVIHRDIKPTNVLVAVHEGQPVPKVIDFGVAKATGQQSLTDHTLFTQLAQIVGTPLYMSPEQAEMSGLDVDTRSDVYSLGVLLYELLTGTTPFDKERLKQAAVDEVRRIIREEEPPRPSTRLSTAAQLPSIAASRGLEPKILSSVVAGELDWIVMKALEKERTRRYETANGLARDVERYLNDESVHACPPTTGYRLRKFVRRNRKALAAATVLAAALLVAAGGITAGVGWAVRDRSARQELAARETAARQAKVSGQLELILDEVARLEQAQKWSEALVSARRAQPALATGEALPGVQQRARRVLGDLELVQRLEDIRGESGIIWGPHLYSVGLAEKADQQYALAFRANGMDVDAMPQHEVVALIVARRDVAAALLPAIDDWVAVRKALKNKRATQRLVDVLHAADPDTWRARARDAVARGDWTAVEGLATSPDLERQPAATLSFLCAALRSNGMFPLEVVVLRRAQWKYPADFWINNRLGTSLTWFKRPQEVHEGIGFLRAAVAVRPQSDHAAVMLGNGYFFVAEYDQAIAWYRKAIEMRGKSSESAAWYSSLGMALAAIGQHEAAVSAFEQSIKLKPGSVETYCEFAMVLSNRREAHLRDPARGVELAEKAIQLKKNVGGCWSALGVARYRQDQSSEALPALTKSLELGGRPEDISIRGEGQFIVIDWLFLAMAHWKLGHADEARRCYQQAVAKMDNPLLLKTDELIGFRAEAAEVLGIPR